MDVFRRTPPRAPRLRMDGRRRDRALRVRRSVVKSPPMPDPASVEAIRAAVDAIVPPTDGLPGGAELRVEDHIVEQAEGAMQGSSELIAALLNAYAEGVRTGVGFAALSRDE